MERWEREAAARLPGLLRDWLDVEEVDVRSEQHPNGDPDLIVRAAGFTLVAEVKGTDNIAALERAAAQMAAYRTGREIALVVVPYMNPKARKWAREQKVAWADLSGNAEIHARGLHVHVEGHKNRYAGAGRAATPFAPRFSRVSRALLADADRWWRQAELCEETGLPDGTISKAVHRLTRIDLLERNDAGAIRSRSPSLLLDAWAQRYSFNDHDLRRYHAVGRSGNAMLKGLADKLSTTTTVWAATGLCAAYMYTQFADFRLTSIYVDRFPDDPESLGLRPVERGENVWLIGPRDEGVFYKKIQQGAWCAHPVQVYLDLPSQAERSAEAASRLREEWMNWRA
jgi:hypothetical protein